MSVHLNPFLRKTSSESLRVLFANGHFGAGDFATIDWQASRGQLVTSLTEAIQALGPEHRERVYADVDRIGQFANEHGRRVLRAVLPEDPDTLARFDVIGDVTSCAVFVLTYDERVFDDAVAALYAQRLLNGRDWTGYDFAPPASPVLRAEPDTSKFEGLLSQIFTEDGRPARVAVDRFTRRDPDPGGTGKTFREQFTIYVESAPEAELTFAGTAVEPRIVRPVLEGAVLFDAAEGTLDVVGKRAGKERRQDIADAFVEAFLEPGADLSHRSRRTLSLAGLRAVPTFDVQPGDGVRNVEVIKLSLAAPDSGAIVTIEVRGQGRRSSRAKLYEQAEHVFGQHGILQHEAWPVISAKLRVEFAPERPNAKPKPVVFELKAPDRTNLRDQMELHRRIADTLLERWGLYSRRG